MTQEDKELLLKDLAARLLYGVKISLNTEGIQNIGVLDALYPNDECIIVDHLEKRFPLKNGYGTIDYGRFSLEESNFKPYLRPMSSMTGEERHEMEKIIGSNPIEPFGALTDTCDNLVRSCAYGSYLMLQYLYSHHFDVINLIEKGLALEAPEGMYT